MKTQIDLQRALCGAAVGAGIFSDGATRNQLASAENLAWLCNTQTGKVLTRSQANARDLDHHGVSAGPKAEEPK